MIQLQANEKETNDCLPGRVQAETALHYNNWSLCSPSGYMQSVSNLLCDCAAPAVQSTITIGFLTFQTS
jgi:hypothetical protein